MTMTPTKNTDAVELLYIPSRITYDQLDRHGLWQRPAKKLGVNSSLQRRGDGVIALCYEECDVITWYSWGHIRLDAPKTIATRLIDLWNGALWDIAEIHIDSRMHYGYSVTLTHQGDPVGLVDTNGFVRGMILGYDKRVEAHTKVLDSMTISKLIEDNILPESARMRFDS